MGSRVDLFARIRPDARVDGLGIRALARKHGVGRDTVRTALTRADPPPRKVPVRSSPRLEPFKAAIVDRLTFNGTIIETGTESYRLAHTRQPL